MTDATPSDRLNKHLALQLGISRRAADRLIEQGRVHINQAVATLGARITATDTIMVDGQIIQSNTAFIYLAVHKPVGYVCSRRSQGGQPTIYELLPAQYHDLKTVGRLDYNSSGLILLTNDGDFTYQMTHPKFYKRKVYEVRLDHELPPLHQQMINDYGIQLDDGTSQLQLERLSDSNRADWRVTMSEGRNRQIRRTFASLGYEVTKLHRIAFGNYTLGDLKTGQVEVVSPR